MSKTIIEQDDIKIRGGAKSPIKRDSGIEILRILAMLMVLALHLCKDMSGWGTGITSVSYDMLGVNSIAISLCRMLCLVAVNCFVLITGYFTVTSDRIKIGKCINVAILTMFYGVLIYITSVFCGYQQFALKEFIKCSVPFFFDRTWFVNIFIILCMISPFLNILLKALDKRKYEILLVITLAFFSIWPSFLPNPPNNDEGYGIITFVLLYIIGGYLRLHYRSKHKSYTYFGLYLLFVACNFVAVYFCGVMSGFGYNSIFVILGSIMLFMVFREIDFYSKIINLIASSTFGVFIIHTHNSIRQLLFVKIFRVQEHLMDYSFILYSVMVVVTVFILCISIDLLRKQIYNRFMKKRTENLYVRIDGVLNKK